MVGLKRDIPTKYPKNMPLKASEEWKSWLANTEFNLLSVPDNVTGTRVKGKRLLKCQTIYSLLFKSVALWLCTSPITINYPALARSWPSRRTILGCIIGKVHTRENGLLRIFPDKNLDHRWRSFLRAVQCAVHLSLRKTTS